MKTLWDSSKRVVYNSMKISGEKVHSSIPFNLDLPVDIRDCAVSFDASWHRRGHFSNQGFAAAIDSEFGKVLDYQLYAGSVTIAVNGQRRGRLIILMSLWSIGVSMNRTYGTYGSYVPPTFPDHHKQWRARQQWRFGNALSQITISYMAHI